MYVKLDSIEADYVSFWHYSILLDFDVVSNLLLQ